MQKKYPSQRDLLKQFGIKAKKSLSQNFLIRDDVLDTIADLCDLHGDDYVVEIGAGLGGLTCRLHDRAQGVFAIEKDRRLAQILETHIVKSKKTKVIHQDAFLFDYERAAQAADRPLIVAGNLPYSVASRLTIELLGKHPLIKRMVLMYQKEVAERITAVPGTKAYGFLTVVCNLHADVELLLRVGRNAFFPKPKVDSQVLGYVLLPSPRFTIENETYFLNVVKAAFAQRRKKLRNSLRTIKGMPVPADIVDATLEQVGLDANRRGETLSVEEFCRLANKLFAAMNRES